MRNGNSTISALASTSCSQPGYAQHPGKGTSAGVINKLQSCSGELRFRWIFKAVRCRREHFWIRIFVNYGCRTVENEVPEGTIERSIRVGSDTVKLRLIPNAGQAVEMGSNVSREKGLNRRSVSSGHLDAPLPKIAKGQGSHITNHITSQTTNAFSGSLPNYLDSEDDPKNNNMSMNHVNDMELFLHDLLSKKISKEEPLLPPPPLFHDQETEKSVDEDILESLLPKYPFITKENLFEVNLSKGSRGLGFSVTGGIDCQNEPWPGIIRIKRLFPHQPAWQDGKLAPGDVLLEADGTPLTGLTNYEALEVLRTTLSEVRLKVARPPAGAGLLPIEPEETDSKMTSSLYRHNSHKVSKADRSSDESDDELNSVTRPCSSGEFDFEMAKVDKSLGFTLRKEDDSRLGHYVLALVKEPAISDGRIRPGDKIVAVNGVDISPLTHKQAIAHLRTCGDVVHLRLYRDPAQTPLSFLSPDGFRTFPRTKPLLRKEAIDMLSDLAGKKLSTPQEADKRRKAASEEPTPTSQNNTTPRRRKAKPPSPAENTENNKTTKLIALETEKDAAELSLDLNSNEGESNSRNSSRPVSLDLSTPSSGRKQKFQFMSPPFGDDDDDDDASVIAGLSPPNEYPGPSSLVSQPASMPPMNLEPQFIHRKPEYQSANLLAYQTSPASSDQDIPDNMHQGNQGLLKWKGIMFTADKNGPTTKMTTPAPPHKKPTILNLEDRKGTVIVVELTRGWNSRLGFTLCADNEGRTLVKDIYPDSVAYKDGRIKSGDHLVMVNDDNIEHLPTDEVIDLVRKIRGTVAITIIRPDKESL